MIIMEGTQPKGEEGKIVQMGIVVNNLEEAMERYYRDFKWGPWGIWNFETPDLTDVYVRGVRVESLGFKIALCVVGSIQIELIQPLYGTTVHTEFLKKHGEGIQHVKMYYEDIPKALDSFREKGIFPLQSGKFGKDIHVYLDTEDKYGIIWEIGNQEYVGEPRETYPK